MSLPAEKSDFLTCSSTDFPVTKLTSINDLSDLCPGIHLAVLIWTTQAQTVPLHPSTKSHGALP
jgi:hypothetical protein